MKNILVKFPSRSRPELFTKTLSEYIDIADNNDNIQYLISCDIDDELLDDYVKTVVKKRDQGINISCDIEISTSKIHACNRGVNEADEWDIILLISDDMHVQVKGWDTIIRNDMVRLYPDTDGCLWYHDGSDQRRISTLSCMGRKYYDRFGYIYHPSYKSFWCDNEYTEVAARLGKITFMDNVIINHKHPAWYKDVKMDALYNRNYLNWNHDIDNYHNRKSLNFSL